MKSVYIIFFSVAISVQTLAQKADTVQCDILQCTDEGVGIGTPIVPTGYKLAVNGKMLMENGRVEVESKWPDYVFDKEYNTMRVDDLKKYIRENGHLPDVPAAADVQKEGLDVAEINVLLMKKVEELSLYIIQLQERLNKLKQEQGK